MPLTQLAIKNAKPKEKPYKLGDGGGLYLLVTPTGGKCWRHKYRYANREKVLSFGTYPELSLADARERRDEARKLKAKGIDPAEVKREQKQQQVAEYENNFESIAREWHALKSKNWSPYYSKQMMQRMENDLFPKIGRRPIGKIYAPELLKLAQTIQARNAIEIGHRAVTTCKQVFQYAIITGRTLNNPANGLHSALITPKTKHYACLTVKELPKFFEDLDAYNGDPQTKLAVKLLTLTFVRTSELCNATWTEIDFEKAEWRIPAERMKMRRPHIVPLSRQAIEILTILKRLNGKWEHVLASVQSPRKSMGNSTMLIAFHRMGYKGKVTGHGFRATAATCLNESGLFLKDAIERQLTHVEGNRVRASYDHSEHLALRREMMQWWANELEKAGLSYVTPH